MLYIGSVRSKGSIDNLHSKQGLRTMSKASTTRPVSKLLAKQIIEYMTQNHCGVMLRHDNREFGLWSADRYNGNFHTIDEVTGNIIALTDCRIKATTIATIRNN